jgi:hypothetical protein
MKILQGDDWSFTHIVQSFLLELCPEERKAEVEALLESKDWTALDNLMEPFYNTEQ